jgi:hypothetical protein
MATYEKQKNREQLRVYISRKDKEFWDENVDKATLKNWINLGKRSDLAISEIKKEFSIQMEELQEKIEKLSDSQGVLLALLTNISRLINLTTTQNQVEIEEIKYKQNSGQSLSVKEKNILKLADIKDHNFNNLLEKMFLKVDSTRLLSLKKEGDLDA